MDLQQVINGVQKHVYEAQENLADEKVEAAADCLAEAAGLIQREIGGTDEEAADSEA